MKFISGFLLLLVMLFLAACPAKSASPTDPTASTNTVSSTTNGNVVTNVTQVVTTTISTNYFYKRSWGGYGTADGQMDLGNDIAFGLDFQIYVTDLDNNRIQVFDTNGNFLRKWGSVGTGNGQFSLLGGMAISTDGKVYVFDNNRVQVFTTNGVYLNKWGSSGTGNGQFGSGEVLNKILIDPNGDIWVIDRGNSRAQKFDTNGTYLAQYAISGETMRRDGTNFWVGSYSAGTIKKFDFAANLGQTLGPSTNYSSPGALAINQAGDRIFVGGDGLHKIAVLDMSGSLKAMFGNPGTNINEIKYVRSILVDSQTNIYVANQGDYRIKVFSWGIQTNATTNFVTTVVTNN
ncbi:MAG: hypothetical protein J0L75_10805 [Spirochaetes bacterium]|nr:hypothetical protein [Spirochaetota bacterium]